ncbi:MAG: molybdopterin dinucleotide binding domain-containing protein, partial [Halioglobus sp.]
DSMACADIILPAATHLEYGDLYGAYGHHYLQRSEAVIEPLGEALPNTELFRRLAARFGFEEAIFSTGDDALVDLAVAADTDAMAGRRAMDIGTDEAVDMSVGSASSLFRGSEPATPSGKIELFSESLERTCGEGLPRYRELVSQYRFTLVSPSSEFRTNSTFGSLEGHDGDLVVEMHPEDAGPLGLGDGQAVRLYNDQGEVILPLLISSKVRPSTVYVPKGSWLSSSVTGQTINALIPGHRADIAGGACYNDARVDVAAL